MKKYLTLLLGILVAVEAFGATAQVNNVMQFSGISSSSSLGSVQTVPLNGIDISNFVSIGAGIATGTVGNYVALRQFSTSQYQVPSNKTFYVTDIWWLPGTINPFNLGYGTAALVSDNTATPPTGNTWLLLNKSVGYGPFNGKSDTNYAHFSIPGLTFPAGSYPYFQATGTSGFEMILTGFLK